MAFSKRSSIEEITTCLGRGKSVLFSDGSVRVECEKHPGSWLVVDFVYSLVDPWFDVKKLRDAMIATFDKCPGCIKDSGKDFEEQYAKSRFPEGAEL